jgi:hypothetical protein
MRCDLFPALACLTSTRAGDALFANGVPPKQPITHQHPIHACGRCCIGVLIIEVFTFPKFAPSNDPFDIQTRNGFGGFVIGDNTQLRPSFLADICERQDSMAREPCRIDPADKKQIQIPLPRMNFVPPQPDCPDLQHQVPPIRSSTSAGLLAIRFQKREASDADGSQFVW